jgi:predicted RNase H-like nuclease (RuvC/YqgF family)
LETDANQEISSFSTPIGNKKRKRSDADIEDADYEVMKRVQSLEAENAALKREIEAKNHRIDTLEEMLGKQLPTENK